MWLDAKRSHAVRQDGKGVPEREHCAAHHRVLVVPCVCIKVSSLLQFASFVLINKQFLLYEWFTNVFSTACYRSDQIFVVFIVSTLVKEAIMPPTAHLVFEEENNFRYVFLLHVTYLWILFQLNTGQSSQILLSCCVVKILNPGSFSSIKSPSWQSLKHSHSMSSIYVHHSLSTLRLFMYI